MRLHSKWQASCDEHPGLSAPRASLSLSALPSVGLAPSAGSQTLGKGNLACSHLTPTFHVPRCRGRLVDLPLLSSVWGCSGAAHQDACVLQARPGRGEGITPGGSTHRERPPEVIHLGGGSLADSR